MTHPIPPGTRDVLPDEMRELRAITERMRAAFQREGYGEIYTPALEYESVLRSGDERAAGAAYRLFDEHGEVLALRSDATIPIARVVATRYRDAEPPLRLCYFTHSYRAVDRGVGESREFLQGGLELVGVPGPEGEAEVVALTVAALHEAGLRAPPRGRGRQLALPPAAGRVRRARGEPHAAAHRPLAARPRGPRARGDPSRPGRRRARSPAAAARAPGRARGARPGGRARAGGGRGPPPLHELLAERGVADRVIFDLGLVRALGYYTGAVFEVYDPAVGFTLGGGGRYDDLIGRFGRDLPGLRDRRGRGARAHGAGGRGGAR